ncbi:hypothetical protein Vca1114GL_00062 [Vibrio campbellii]|uniref:hypothetical protein n=1 Tax=Vibrio campbellii TaxID=680 RepID=UPI00097FA74F|nr:hypothetical protein [Vibrio campbellii]AQM66585.1 hypothetical protein Vca1114GL_00062 [Vibrio campbellii]
MIYSKGPEQESDVLVFGKSEVQITQDIKNGISRFGGIFRQPSYPHAYLNSAKVLLDNAISNNQLDEFGLPIFYMVRHATELKLKHLLGLVFEVLRMRDMLEESEESKAELPSSKQLKRFEGSHEINKLYDDLKCNCKKIGIVVPNFLFDPVIELIQRYEVVPTWSRYHKSSKGFHVVHEVELPIVQLVKDLESMFKGVSHDGDGHADTLESNLYNKFSHLKFRLDSAEC